jgi:cobalamin-dependent methionine synthase I
LIEAVRTLQYAWDPAPNISVGLSNVSNAVPNEERPLINRVYLAMLMGVGLQMMIANPFDEKQNDVIRWIETKDTGNPLARVYNTIAGRRVRKSRTRGLRHVRSGQAAIWKTAQSCSTK